MRTVAAGGRIAIRTDDDGRRHVEGLAVPYEVATRAGATREFGSAAEAFERGAFADVIAAGRRIPILDRHGGAIVGMADLEDAEDGLAYRGELLDVPEAGPFATRVNAGADGVSMEFDATGPTRRRKGTVFHTKVPKLYAIAGEIAPAYEGARIAVRSMPGRIPNMPTLVETLTARRAEHDERRRSLAAVIDAEQRSYDGDELAELRDIEGAIGRLDATITAESERAQRRTAETAAPTAATGAPPDPFRELRAYRSLAEWTLAAIDDTAVSRMAARVIVNQITTNNPGVLVPNVLSTIFGILAQTRPAISCLGGARSLGDSGMTITWPYYDGNLDALIGEQATEKTEITSVRVDIKSANTAIKTYAGGSDISYQLLRRSSPSYQEAYSRIMLAAYARKTESVFEAAVLAGAGATIVYDPSVADADGSKFSAFLFEASAKVQDATGSPATCVLVGPDVWLAAGKLTALKPSAYGTQNVVGTAQASTLRINVSGLDIQRAPFLPVKTLIVTNEAAAAWYEDGPLVATAEDVFKLGRDEAYWGMAATGIHVPAGVVKNSLT